MRCDEAEAMSARIKRPANVEGIRPSSSIDTIWRTYLSYSLVLCGMLLTHGEASPKPLPYCRRNRHNRLTQVHLEENAKGWLCAADGHAAMNLLVWSTVRLSMNWERRHRQGKEGNRFEKFEVSLWGWRMAWPHKIIR